MDIRHIVPHYSTLSQADMDRVTALVRRVGFTPVLAALGDIVTQESTIGEAAAPELSLLLGQAMAAARELDRDCPPAG